MADTAMGTATPSGPGNSESGSAETTATSGAEPQVKRYKVKVDGQEREVDEAELLKGYSHGAAAQARMREAAEYRKQLDAISKDINRLRQDPKAIFELGKVLGVDFDSLAHNHVLEKLAYESMTDEERAMHDFKREKETWEQQRAREKAEQAQRDLEANRNRAIEHIENEILTVAQQLPEKPSPKMVERAIEYLIAAHGSRQQLPVARAFELAKRDLDGAQDEHFNAKLQAMIQAGKIPPELANAIRKADVANLRSQSPIKQATQRSEPQKPVKKAATVDDFFNSWEKKR